MRRIRAVAVIASASFVLAASTTAWGAAATGVGTGTLSVTALSVQLGNNGALLGARVVGVDSQSTTDGTALARTVLAPASLSSASLPALNVSVPPVEVKAPGGTGSFTAPGHDLSTPVSTGSVDPATLSAGVDASGAHSTIAASVSNLSIAGGLLAEPSVKVGIDTSSAPVAAASNQNLSLGPAAVLDIGALLKGLGLDLSKLPLDVVSQLLGDLGAKLQGLGATSLATAVTDIQTTITGLRAKLGVTAADLPPVTVPTIPPLPLSTAPLTSLLPGLSIPQLPSSPTPADITNVINQLNSTLANLLSQALQTLANTPVLSTEPDSTIYYAGAASIDLFSSDTSAYRDNLADGAPRIWVALRRQDGGSELELTKVTADPTEGEAMFESGCDVIGTVPMPPDIAAWIAAFVDQFHVERVFHKRKRDRAGTDRPVPGRGTDRT